MNLNLSALFSPSSAGQVDAGMRHVYTAAGTVFTLAAAVAIIPQDQVQPALDALHQIGDGVKQIMGGFSALWVILGPVVMGFAAKRAMGSATPTAQLKAVTSNPDIKINGTIEAPAAVADAVPSNKVVSVPATPKDTP